MEQASIRPDCRLKYLDKKCKYYHIEIIYAYGSRSKEAARYINDKGVMKKGIDADVDIGIKTVKGYRFAPLSYNPYT